MRRVLAVIALLALSAGACSSDLLDQMAPAGGAEARWGVDPTVRLADDATTIPILVNEVDCASGQDASGRINHQVDYSDEFVTITVRVTPLEGDQNCPSNPNTPHTVELSEPLDGRTLVNGASSETAQQKIEFVGDGPGPGNEEVEGLAIEWPGGTDERLNFLVTSLHARAQDHEELADLGDLSLHPDGIELRLGNSGHAKDVAVDELHDPAAWAIEAPEGYAGFAGPFSVLDTLKGRDRLMVTIGEHDHCAGPPRPAPAHLDEFTRVGIQPTDAESCIDWFAVDLHLDADGLVRGIVLDLFGP